MSEARVLVIYTGGTIGMGPRELNNPVSPLAALGPERLMKYLPDFRKVGKGIDLKISDAFGPPIDSSDMEPKDWARIAEIIRDHYAEYTGFVVLHGTDTMAYTASALSFILEHLDKPVVITGSQLPISDLLSDGPRNLVASIHIAGFEAVDLPCIPEVVLCFDTQILRGCRTAKVDSGGFQAFVSPNFPPLGTVGERIEINERLIKKRVDSKKQRFFIRDELIGQRLRDVVVGEMSLMPNNGRALAAYLDYSLRFPQMKGLILRTYGAGNGRTTQEFLDTLAAHSQRSENNEGDDGVVILNVTQCLKGTVEMGRYVNSSELLERGVVSGLDLTLEAACAKMWWCLATQKGEERMLQLQISHCGEQSENLYDLRFGGTGSTPVKQFVESLKLGLQLNMDMLTRATIRLSDLKFAPGDSSTPAGLRVFLNRPDATGDTSVNDPRCLGEFRGDWNRDQTLLRDITDHARTLITEDTLYVSVIPVGDVAFSFRGLCIAIWEKATF